MIERIFQYLISLVGKILKIIIYGYGIMLCIFIVLAIVTFIANAVKGQTYVCTDISCYNTNKTSKEIQKLKKDALGSICVLEFYDNSVKFAMFPKDGKEDSGVLDGNGAIYQFVEQSGYHNGQPIYEKIVIELNYFLDWDLPGYISSFTMSAYENDELKIKATFKRK